MELSGDQAVEEVYRKNGDGEHLSEDLFAESPPESGFAEPSAETPAVRQLSEPQLPANESAEGQDSQTPLLEQSSHKQHPNEQQLDEKYFDGQDSEQSGQIGISNEIVIEESYYKHIPEEGFDIAPLSRTPSSQPGPEALSFSRSGDRGLGMASIGKVTMLYGDRNPVYESALEGHMEHGRRHGYQIFVLRRQLLGRLWSKPAYILSILLEELQKPPESRLKWLL